MKVLLNLEGVVVLDNLYMLFVIVNNSDEKYITKIFNKYKIGFKFVVNGMGTASSSVLEYFGLNQDDKTVINVIVPSVVCKCLLRDLIEKGKFNEHGKGIAFSIPLSSGTKYMLDYYSDQELEDVEMEEVNQHLIATIVNAGNAEKVMTEAKKGGATGGTTLNGRGMNSDKIIKFLNITIEPEKDIVLILVKDDIKNDVMKKIIDGCGLKTPGAGICFSLPVDYVAGLHEQLNS